MKNKKGQHLTIGTVIAAAIGLTLLAVIVWGIINGVLVKKQIVHAGGETERITQDCDDDGAIGLFDDCPCDPNKKKLEEEEKCGTASDTAVGNCPALCRK